MSAEKPLTKAAGVGAIKKSIEVGVREMGPIRMLRGWSAINQKGGFDCPSCAWADPDGPRRVCWRRWALPGSGVGQVDVATGAVTGLPIKMAVMVLAIVPILIVYPFVQRHFTKGVIFGAIKG